MSAQENHLGAPDGAASRCDALSALRNERDHAAQQQRRDARNREFWRGRQSLCDDLLAYVVDDAAAAASVLRMLSTSYGLVGDYDRALRGLAEAARNYLAGCECDGVRVVLRAAISEAERTSDAD